MTDPTDNIRRCTMGETRARRRRYIFSAVVNPLNTCDFERAQCHSRADRCTHSLYFYGALAEHTTEPVQAPLRSSYPRELFAQPHIEGSLPTYTHYSTALTRTLLCCNPLQDIRGRQGTVWFGLESGTVRLLHKASSLIHCSLCCRREAFFFAGTAVARVSLRESGKGERF